MLLDGEHVVANADGGVQFVGAEMDAQNRRATVAVVGRRQTVSETDETSEKL